MNRVRSGRKRETQAVREATSYTSTAANCGVIDDFILSISLKNVVFHGVFVSLNKKGIVLDFIDQQEKDEIQIRAVFWTGRFMLFKMLSSGNGF